MGHVLSIDFCSCQESRAQPRISKPLRMMRRRTAARRETWSRRSTFTRLCSSGVALPTWGLATPASASARRRGFSPTCLDLGTPCRMPRCFAVWITATKHDRADGPALSCWPVVYGPVLPISGGRPARGPCLDGSSCLGRRIRRSDEPLGPPSNVARESNVSRPHPRCLPLPSPPRPRSLDAHRAFGFRLYWGYPRWLRREKERCPMRLGLPAPHLTASTPFLSGRRYGP